MNKMYFNRNFLIRYYPDRNRLWKNTLIGLDRFKEIIGDDTIYENQIKRIEQSQGDVLTINLRRGETFKVVSR